MHRRVREGHTVVVSDLYRGHVVVENNEGVVCGEVDREKLCEFHGAVVKDGNHHHPFPVGRETERPDDPLEIRPSCKQTGFTRANSIHVIMSEICCLPSADPLSVVRRMVILSTSNDGPGNPVALTVTFT